MRVIKFSAPWCGPCKQYAPIFDGAMKKFPEITPEYIDLDKNPELGREYRVMAVPSTVIFNDDWEEIFNKPWILSAEELHEEIEK